MNSENKMKFFNNMFSSNKEKKKDMPENESNHSSETLVEVFNTIDIPIRYRDSDIYFQEYRQLDGEWVEKGKSLCEIRFGQHLSPYGFLTSSMVIKSTKSGVLEFTLEKGDLLSDGTIIGKLYAEGQYLTNNTPQNFEYKEFFTDPSQNLSFDRWLVPDGEYVKVGQPVFQFKDSNSQLQINYSKKEGFIHKMQPLKIYSLQKNDLIYIIRDIDDQRIEERFVNLSNIIIDEFINTTIINWNRVSAFKMYQGIITKSDDFNTDLLFSFNFINDSDSIIFHFNPKQIRPKQFDKIIFLFENGEQIQFELATNPVQSKNSTNENILEYKSIITNAELQLFSNLNFKKWKISLVSDKREILGGDISGDSTYYAGKNNIQIAIKKFANDYIDLVKETIPNYQPTILNETTEFKEKIAEICYVYLMHDTSNDYYKIGISNNPSYRERTLQSEKPTIEVIISKKFPVRKIAESIEKALHETFSEKRLRGEWFELDLIDVGHIKETLS